MTPGARVRALIEELGLDQIKFAEQTKVSRQTISNIVNGHQRISLEMASKLAKLSVHPANFWLQEEFSDGPSSPLHPEAEAGFPPGILVDDQIHAAVKSGLIDIDPFEPAQVKAASVDLRLDAFIKYLNGKQVDISGGPVTVLRPNEAVMVESREFVGLPDTMLARVGAMTKVTRHGIMMGHGFQIDPGFRGHLQFSLFNASGENFDLISGMDIISIEFVSLARRPSNKTPPREHARDDVGKQQRGALPPASCDDLLRSALRRHVKITDQPDGVVAEVPDLGIRERNKNAKVAADDMVQQLLTALRSSAKQPQFRDQHAKYLAFFVRVAEQIYLDVLAIKSIADGLGLTITDNLLDLGNGTFLTLSPGSGEVDLAFLARKIGIEPATVFIRLTRPTKALPFHPTPSISDK